MTPNQKAFLDLIASSEIGPKMLAQSDNGYNVLVGSMPGRLLLMANYDDHPAKVMRIEMKGKIIFSSAAGRYQLLTRYWRAYKKMLRLSDFSPASQDAVALQQIKEQGAFASIEAGDIATAVDKCKNIWASFPGAGYGQHEVQLSKLLAAYVNAGGKLA